MTSLMLLVDWAKRLESSMGIWRLYCRPTSCSVGDVDQVKIPQSPCLDLPLDGSRYIGHVGTCRYNETVDSRLKFPCTAEGWDEF